ncbi:BgTH12-07824 [Blumeria graminis f. sp. triticale]|uniref:BgTH12-07824 n=1 Tax=Blumeria graminis f. sp. triticale TaxID=1689686 RepID=A0A9W4D9B8_BLUGR|nr:BgTH12-07824 [Blumeria graminis f. sp. triticale]
MKCFTLASFTAMLSILTNASAEKYYECNGKHILYSKIVENANMGYKALFGNGDNFLATLPGQNPITVYFKHKFDYYSGR